MFRRSTSAAPAAHARAGGGGAPDAAAGAAQGLACDLSSVGYAAMRDAFQVLSERAKTPVSPESRCSGHRDVGFLQAAETRTQVPTYHFSVPTFAARTTLRTLSAAPLPTPDESSEQSSISREPLAALARLIICAVAGGAAARCALCEGNGARRSKARPAPLAAAMGSRGHACIHVTHDLLAACVFAGLHGLLRAHGHYGQPAVHS